MNGRFGEMKKLIKMLLEARIPFEHIVQYNSFELTKDDIEIFGEASKYLRNQINYYHPDGTRVFDCILQYGSYGCEKGLFETYCELGVDEEGNPKVMTAEEAFEIIKKDWEKQNADADVVEEVRCEKCKHYDYERDVCHNPRFGDGHANYPPPYVREDFYCADGKRREEDV